MPTLSKWNQMTEKRPENPFFEKQQVERCERDTKETEQYVRKSHVGDEQIGNSSHRGLAKNDVTHQNIARDTNNEDQKVDQVENDAKARVKVDAVLHLVHGVVQ